VIGGALEVIVGRNLDEAGDVALTARETSDRGTYVETRALLQNKTHREELPMVTLTPKTPNGHTVIWVEAAGKAALFQADGSPRADVAALLAKGATVIGVDLLFQGEFLADGRAVERTRHTKGPVVIPAYTFGYNHALFAQRVHDVLSTVRHVQSLGAEAKSIHLIGGKGAGAWVAAARAMAGGAIASAAVDTEGFRFGKILDVHDVNFLPGGAKYHDLPGMLALHAPGRLWLAGETNPGVIARMYAAAGAEKNLTLAGDRSAAAMVAWLTSSF
jgi:hypothetical protein